MSVSFVQLDGSHFLLLESTLKKVGHLAPKSSFLSTPPPHCRHTSKALTVTLNRVHREKSNLSSNLSFKFTKKIFFGAPLVYCYFENLGVGIIDLINTKILIRRRSRKCRTKELHSSLSPALIKKSVFIIIYVIESTTNVTSDRP